MDAPNAHAAAQSYIEICDELGCPPAPQFLACLQNGSRLCKVTGFDREEQLYATVSLLPYANLDELDFSGLNLSLEGWSALLEGCSKCQGLQVLSLKGCALGALGEDAQEKVASYIGTCQVVVLDVSQNDLGDNFVLALSQLPLVCGGDRLTVLDLSDNAITDDGVAVLAGTLEVDGLNCGLKQLDLSFNRLEDKGACAIASMLTSVPLLALELEGNQIGDTGSMALASALKGALCLQRLNLNHNRFSSQTLSAIADALRVNAATLQELAVAGASGSSEEGVAALLLAACSSKHLQLLDIRGLPLRAQAVDALCQLLSSPAPLVTMRLDVATKEAAETIAQALPRNSSLLHLMVGGPVPEHVLSFVAASLSSNTLNRLQQQGQAAANAAANSPGGGYGYQQAATPLSQQKQQQLWSPNRPASAGPGLRSSPGSFRAHTPMSSRSRQASPGRPASAGLMGSGCSGGGVSGPRHLLRSTTQQARQLSTLDMTGLAGLAGGGAANKAAEVFRRHDSDASGFLDAEEMMAALQDLGMLEGMKARQLGKFLSNAIREADMDRDGRVSLEEFCKYYERLARYYSETARQGRIIARRRAPIVPVDASSNDHLKRVFRAYCRLRIGQGRQVGASVQHINAAQFNQMCRDAGLLEPYGPLSQCAVDIVFTRCKPPGSRRLSVKEFLEAVASVADEAGCSFDAITEALVVTSSGSPPLSQTGSPSRPDNQPEGEFYAGAGLLAAAAARGSLSTRALRISDLMDNKVGPVLPGRASSQCVSRGSAVSMSHDSGLPAGAGAASLWGSGAGALSPPGAGRAGGLGGPGGSAAVSPGMAAYKAARMTSVLSSASPPSGAGVRLQAAAAGQQQQQERQGAARDAVENPLFEKDNEGNSGATPKGKAFEARLNVLEGKLAVRGTVDAAAAAAAAAEGGMPAGAASGDLTSRLLLVEEAVAEQQQQLAAVVGQQEALKEVVTRLVESLQGADLASGGKGAAASSSNSNSSELQELSKQVQALVLEVTQLKAQAAKGQAEQGLDDKLQEVARKLDDRQTRAETAIYQVARQVDVLDARLRDEQESSLKALEAILANASPAK